MSHTSLQADNHSFSYNIPELVIAKCSSLPNYWFGGVFLEDHWNQNGTHLLHSIPRLVLRRLGFYPDGEVLLLTTCRAFGQVMNPISVFVCLSGKGDPQAIVLEVHNYPWNELNCYAIDARNGQMSNNTFSLSNCRFSKTLHVSPWHPHPEDMNQTYVASFEIDLDDRKPFHRFHMALKLNDDKEKTLFSSSKL